MDVYRAWRVICGGLMVAVVLGVWCCASLAAQACVSRSGACYPSLAQALERSRNGDTITLSKGIFQGGVAVKKSVRLVGAGRRSTVITGGGPVLTIGTLLGHIPEWVTIEHLAVTDGVTVASHVGPEQARGGGIWIPPRKGFRRGSDGASRRCVDRRQPGGARRHPGSGKRTRSRRLAGVPGRPVPALADGGGIENWGALTLDDSAVIDNYVGGQASDADGAGVSSFGGSVSIENSRITGNTAVASAPNGRFAEGAGG